jgi:hypothetical protein
MSSGLSQLQGLQGSGIVKVAGVYESLPADSGSVFVRVSRLLNTARFQDCRLLLSRRFDLSRFSLNAGSTMTPALSHASYSRRRSRSRSSPRQRPGIRRRARDSTARARSGGSTVPTSAGFTMWVTPPNAYLLQPFIQEFVRRSSDSRGEFVSRIRVDRNQPLFRPEHVIVNRHRPIDAVPHAGDLKV